MSLYILNIHKDGHTEHYRSKNPMIIIGIIFEELRSKCTNVTYYCTCGNRLFVTSKDDFEYAIINGQHFIRQDTLVKYIISTDVVTCDARCALNIRYIDNNDTINIEEIIKNIMNKKPCHQVFNDFSLFVTIEQ